jgi:hypothetical protein
MLPSIDFLVVAPWPRRFAPLALLWFRLIALSVAKGKFTPPFAASAHFAFALRNRATR